MLDDYKTRHNIERAGILPTTVMGITSGGIGAIIGNPADVALVRMTVDKRLPPAERRNYTSVFNAWRRIIAEEGFMSLWTGCRPTIGRAMVVNACQLSINTQAKYKLQTYSSSKYSTDIRFRHAFYSKPKRFVEFPPVNACFESLGNQF